MRFFTLTLLLVCAFRVHAQVPDDFAPASPPDTAAAPADTGSHAIVRKDGFIRRIFTKDYPNPRTAAYLSLAFPGAGQAYNRRWWKLPIVYGVLGAATYFEIQNYNQYAALRDNYKWVVDEDPNTNPTEAPYTQLDATSLKNYRDQWRRYFEQTTLILGLAYILTATEAFVDAHLSRFDVSDDLSFRVRPAAQTVAPGAGIALGIGVSLQFGASPHRKPPSTIP